MKSFFTLVLLSFLTLAFLQTAKGQTQLAAWTFDTTSATPNTPTAVKADFGVQNGTAELYADGTNGSSSWDKATELAAFSGTTVNDPRNAGSQTAGQAYCLLDSSANGKSIVLKFSMNGYKNLVLAFATRGTASGFNSQQWAWSTDGTSFTDIGPNTAINTSIWTIQTIDLSGATGLNNADTVYLRNTFNGAASQTGNNRLDNIILSAQSLSDAAYYPIDSLKMNDQDGVPLFNNSVITTSGIVTSITQLGTGTSGPGSIQNANTGISVYGSAFTGTPGLQIGDSVVITNWKETSYRGLTELGSTDSSKVQIISSGHKVNPTVVTIPDVKNQAWNGFEKYEGMLIRINDVHFVQTGTFDIGSSSGVNFQVYNGTDTADFRIVKTNTSLIGKGIPVDPVDIVGIVQQYKSSSPYNSGYQILPLDSSGIITKNIIPAEDLTLLDSLKMNDQNGVPLKVNDTINTSGIVTSITQLGTGTSGPGTIQNSNTGISLYGSAFTQTPGLQIGDSVIISNWKVTNYRGLNELATTDSSKVKIISAGHKVNPAVVTIPDIKNQAWNGFEKYEGMLVRINNIRFVQTGTFDIGTSTGANFQIYKGADTLDLRIVKNNTSLIGKNIPSDSVDVVGIIQQYKSASPYNSGYQIFPLDSTGIIAISAAPKDTLVSLDSLKTNDATGLPLMLNDTISTAGIVTSILQLGTGTSGPGTFQNAHTGISIYGSAFTQTPGLQIGDSVIVSRWKVTNYNGLNELASTADSKVTVVSHGHKISPLTVTIPEIKNQKWNGLEKYESMLLKLNDVHFVQTGDFTITGSGTNYQIVNGTDTLDFRLVKTNTSIIGKPIPTTDVSIIGILGQYKTAGPYDSGYQLFPLDSSSIVTKIITEIDSLKMNDENGVSKMLNDTVNTTGIVTSINQMGTGSSGPGSIQNGNTGIVIYGSEFTQTPGLQIGDSVLISNWVVTNYNGLTELKYTSASSVQILSSGHKVQPVVVTIPQIKNQKWNGFEKYEGMFVRLNDVHFVQSGTFDIGTSTGANFQIVNGTDTLDLRIVKNNTSLVGKPIPGANLSLSIQGIIQQYFSASPYNSGYEIFPIDSSSISILDGTENEPNKVYTFNLYQNYPNPFNPSTIIKFSLPATQKVVLTVYDILGRKVRTLFNGVAPQGITSVNFDASSLASGVYIYTIRTSSSVISKKLMLLK